MFGKRKKNIYIKSDKEAMDLCDKMLELPDDEFLKLVEECTPDSESYKMITGEEAPMIHVNYESAEPSMLELLYKIKFREKYLDSKGENF